jgi:hypothetical protein
MSDKFVCRKPGNGGHQPAVVHQLPDHGPVPETERLAVVGGRCHGCSIVDHDHLAFPEERPCVAQVHQKPVAGIAGKFELLPQVPGGSAASLDLQVFMRRLQCSHDFRREAIDTGRRPRQEAPIDQYAAS